jgi:hypothetical protein
LLLCCCVVLLCCAVVLCCCAVVLLHCTSKRRLDCRWRPRRSAQYNSA